MEVIWRRPHRRYRIEFGVDETRAEFFLRVNGCERKTRKIDPARANYVWTNIEMEWEEHRYLEGWLEVTGAGYHLRATENGVPIDHQLVRQPLPSGESGESGESGGDGVAPADSDGAHAAPRQGTLPA